MEINSTFNYKYKALLNGNGNEMLSEYSTLLLFIFSCTSMKIQKYINGNKNTFEGKNKAHLNGNENMSKSCTLLLFIFSRTLIEIQKQDRNSVR